MIDVNKYPGDTIFQKKLDKIGSSMNVYEVRMFIAGLLLGPETVMPSYVLDEILMKDTEDEVVWKDEEDAKEFMSMFMGLWNQIAGYAGSSKRYPVLSESVQSLDTRGAKLEQILKRSDELSWFYSGLEVSGAREWIEQCFDLALAQLELGACDHMMMEVCVKDMEGEVSDEDIEEALQAAKVVEDIWPLAYPDINRICQELRRGEMPLDSEEEMEEKFALLTEMARNGEI